MGQLENNLRATYERTLTRWQRLWRANSGQAWSGRILDTKKGILKLLNFSKIELFPPGTPDMIGFDSVIITPEMVGSRVAVFVGTELKATSKDKLNPSQVNFKKLLVSMGGIHREVRQDGSVIESGTSNPHDKSLVL